MDLLPSMFDILVLEEEDLLLLFVIECLSDGRCAMWTCRVARQWFPAPYDHTSLCSSLCLSLIGKFVLCAHVILSGRSVEAITQMNRCQPLPHEALIFYCQKLQDGYDNKKEDLTAAEVRFAVLPVHVVVNVGVFCVCLCVCGCI